MADHFYSIAARGDANRRNPADIVVATSTQAGPIEVRITDGAMTKQDAYNFLEYIADLLAAMDTQVIVAGDFISGQS